MSNFIFFLNTNGVFILYLVVLLYIFFYERKKEEVLHLLFASSLSVLISVLFKNFLDIPRPYMLNGGKPEAGFYTDSSFPSLHTTLAFAMATTVALHQKKLGIILLIAASLIGIGRVAANVHYPIDIVGGVIIGSAVSLIVGRMHLRVK